jgi:hypothetical protein
MAFPQALDLTRSDQPALDTVVGEQLSERGRAVQVVAEDSPRAVFHISDHVSIRDVSRETTRHTKATGWMGE